MNRIARTAFTIFTLFLLFPPLGEAQISAPGASGFDKTNYPVFAENDDIYIFCAANEGDNIAVLRAQTEWQGSKTFLWEKFNNSTFVLHFSETVETQFSEISGLADGCYRVTITQAANSMVYRAWVFNNWFTVNAVIPDSTSNCESFRMIGDFTTATLNYFDLTNGAGMSVFKDTKVQWKVGESNLATVSNPQIDNPPAQNTEYTFLVYDKFGCRDSALVTYESMIPKAAFSANPVKGEAPLTVTFTNQSENADPNQYLWVFSRNLDEIKLESQGSTAEIDSVMIESIDQSPLYTYENSGQYTVKLVARKISDFYTCADTAYLQGVILVDTSFIAAPNVFTPNGDGVNDEFVVKFWSMQSIQISIFNRWGKRIHYWESGDVRGFEGSMTESVWDGRLMGNRYASPGVYYYDVLGQGRDGQKRRAHGFVHLFRGKD